MDLLSHGLTGGGDNLVVVLDLLALVDERSHLGLAALINEDGGNFEDRLRVEVTVRISYGNSGVDIAGDRFKDFRVTYDLDILGHLDHLLGGRTGNRCDQNGGGCNQSECFCHICKKI